MIGYTKVALFALTAFFAMGMAGVYGLYAGRAGMTFAAVMWCPIYYAQFLRILRDRDEHEEWQRRQREWCL